MSITNFAEWLDNNPEIEKKVKSALSLDEVIKLAKDNGFIITKEELSEYSSNQATELSDDALEAVAGGAWGDPQPPSAPMYMGGPDK